MGIGLVVLEQDIVFRMQLFYQFIFNNKRSVFIFNNNELHFAHFGHHSLQTNRQLFYPRICHNAFFYIFCLTDIQNRTVFIKHTVHSGSFRRNLDIFTKDFQPQFDIKHL